MAGRNKVTFRLAIKSDIPQLVRLMNSQYSRKKEGSYFLWQYFNSCQPTVLMCAFLGDRLVGMFGIQRRRLQNGIIVGQAIDMLIAPELRGKGIFKQLGEKAIQCFHDIDLLCVFPNLNGKKAIEKSFGWKTLGIINSMCLYQEDMQNISKKSLEPSSKPENRIFFKFEYNQKIRDWRYHLHPEYKYSFVHSPSGGIAVTKIFIDPVTGQHIGDIVDFECDINNKRMLRELFVNAILHLNQHSVESITTWALPCTPLFDVLETLGFNEIPQERYFCINVLNLEYNGSLYILSNWHLVQADAEIY